MDTEMVTDMEGAMENRQNNLLGQEEKIDITILIDDMWRCLKKFFWLFLIMIVLGGSFSYFQARRSYVPMYEAYSSFAVKARNSYGYSDTYYNKTIAGQMSKTFPYILTSGVLNQVVAESLGMESVPASISAEAVQNSALFTISVQSQDPQMAHDVLLAVIENYPRVAQYIIGDTELIMVDESGVPDEPVNPPDYTKNVKSGVAGAAVFVLFVMILYAVTRNTVRREKDLSRRVSVPILGVIPMVRLKKRSRKEKPAVLMDQPGMGAALSEGFRSVRTRVMKEAEKTGAKRILVTSAAAGEGKTTVAANLALSMAKKGKNVVLVDLDLRNPSVAASLKMSTPQVGTTEVLKDLASPEEVIRTYGDTSLSVIAGAKPIQNPTRLLGSTRLKTLLDLLSREADYIIMDAPPCALVSDASVLTRYAEGIVMVVRQNYTRIEKIMVGMDNMAETGVPILGYVLNGTQRSIMGNEYGYGYGYGYGRRTYGYGEPTSRADKT